MKKAISIILVAALAVALLACSAETTASSEVQESAASESTEASVSPSTEASESSEASEAAVESAQATGDYSEVTIAQSMPTLNNPWYVLFANGSKDMADRLGIPITQVTNPQTDEWSPEAQISKIENLIALQPSVIEIDPTSTDGINSAIDEAREMGIPVIMSGTKVSTTVDASITGDNLQGGQLCGEYMGQLLGSEGGDIAILDGTPGRDVIQNRQDGFKQALEDYPNINIVAEQVANLARADAVTATENILQAHPDIKAIWAANDEMALGAIEALRSRDLVGKVIVGGFDCTPDAVTAIQNGEMNFTCNQIPYEMGVRAIAFCALEALGKELPGTDVKLPLNIISTENVTDFQNNQEQAQQGIINQVIEEYGL
jgi:ABC-type sugar transport system substrate-binding protein